MHLTLDAFDKATGFAALMSNLNLDPVRELRRAAFLGDSGNDGPAFAAFGLTIGVANVRKHLAKLTVAPGFVASSHMGRGCAEIAERLVELRA
jgi:hydroxymethylpyrimidine pyrophosphatase-like HAD family hydrolase